jgi:hypothetical protein
LHRYYSRLGKTPITFLYQAIDLNASGYNKFEYKKVQFIANISTLWYKRGTVTAGCGLSTILHHARNINQKYPGEELHGVFKKIISEELYCTTRGNNSSQTTAVQNTEK